MKYINFQQLSIRNFFSIGDKPVIVQFKPGTNLITGTNKDKIDRKNGVGKTAICNAFYYSVFGETIETIKRDLLCNTYTNKSTEIILDFTVHENDISTSYKVIRTINATKCYLYCNNIDVTRDSIANTTSDILKILSATPEIFQNCVVLSSNSSLTFLAKQKTEKRKFIESVFNLSVFNKMLLQTRSDYNDHKKLYDITFAKLEQVQSTIKSIKVSNVPIVEQFYPDYTKHTAKVQLYVLKQNAAITKINKALDALSVKRGKLQGLIHDINKNIKQNELHQDMCFHCMRPWDDSTKHVASEEIIKLKKHLQDANKTEKDNEVIVKSVKDKLGVYSTAISKANKLLSKIQWRIAEKGAQKKKPASNLDTLQKEQELRLAELENDLQKEKHSLDLLETAKFVLSEEGVKSHIVGKLLELFNARIMYYLKKLDSHYVIYFNELFEEEILNNRGKICSYFNLSGAERKDVDLACLFTFFDILRLQGGVKYNVTFFDELFDSAVDEKGLTNIINILHDKTREEQYCFMIISHRQENVKNITGETILLEKKNNITIRI